MLKKKNFLRIAVLLFTIVMIMVNCNSDNELVVEQEETIVPKFKKRIINFDELQTKLKNYSRFNEIQNKAGGDDDFITSIDSENIIEYYNDTITTYTLKVNTTETDNSNFINLVIYEKDGELQEYLLKYIPTLAWKVSQFLNQDTLFNGKNQILDFDGTILSEVDVIDGQSTQKTINNCTWQVFVRYDIFFEPYITLELICTSGGGGNDDDDNGNNDPDPDPYPNTGGGGGTDPDPDPPNGTSVIPTEPNRDNIFIVQELFNELLCESNPLTNQQANWIYQSGTNHLGIAQQILDNLYNSVNTEQGECADVDFDELIDDVEDGICSSSFEFTNVGSNWQSAGIRDFHNTFFTCCNPAKIVNIHFPELYIGFPRNSPLVGGLLTNNNARYEAQNVFAQAGLVTNAFQTINPNSTAIELRDYFYTKLDELTAERGGTISTTSDLNWQGELKDFEAYFLSESLECD